MKKLLLLSSIISIGILFPSCRNSLQHKTETANEVKPTINDSLVASDTNHASGQSASAGTSGVDSGISKDTTKTGVKPRAIFHGSPDQRKIDSIKNSKPKK